MDNTNADKVLDCQDCRTQFVFTAGEQSFFDQKGFTPPRRCVPCREKRKAEKNSRQVAEMNSAPPPVNADKPARGRGRFREVDVDDDRGNRWR